jgi:hypothetical protein
LAHSNSSTTIANGSGAFTGGFNRVLLIVQDQNLAVFLNNELLYSADTLELPETSIHNGITAPENFSTPGSFDNVKFWDLDEVEFNQ